MKPEEAIEILELPKDPLESGTHYHAIPSSKRISYADYLSARKAAIQALDKQVPKPIKYATRCPACDEIWYGDGDGYCNNCGQKLEDVNYRKEVKE